MRKEIRRLSIFLFLLFLLFAMAGISGADIEGTIGTRFTITDSGFGTKKPQVYIQYKKKPGVVRKVYAKVEQWSDNSITCLWTETLSAGTYNLFVKPNIAKANPIAEGTFNIMPPSIDEVTPDTLTPGATITINGQFFTNKKPTIYLVDLVSSKKKGCRVVNPTMDPETGASSLNFVVPKWGSGKYEIILQTLVSETSFRLVSISGKVTDSSTGSGISGVTVVLNGVETISAVTVDDGTYSFTNIPDGSYTIAPSPSSYTFSPQNIQ